MARFAKVLKFLGSLYPPSEVGYHNPTIIPDTIQLVQSALPISELLGTPPELVTVVGSAGVGSVETQIMSEDPVTGTTRGIAQIIWTADCEPDIAETLQWFMKSLASGGGAIVAISDPLSTAAAGRNALSVGARGVLPMIVPHKCSLLVDGVGASTLTLRMIRSVIARGEPLPYF